MSLRSADVGVNLIPRFLTSSSTRDDGTPPCRREIISFLPRARGSTGATFGVKLATNSKCEVALAGLDATISKEFGPGLSVMGSDQNSATFSPLGRNAAGAPLIVIVGRPESSIDTPRMVNDDSFNSIVWSLPAPEGAMITSVGAGGGAAGVEGGGDAGCTTTGAGAAACCLLLSSATTPSKSPSARRMKGL